MIHKVFPRKHPIRCRITRALLLLLSSPIAIAQFPAATILGVLRESSRAVVPGVTLTAHNWGTGQTRTTVAGGTSWVP